MSLRQSSRPVRRPEYWMVLGAVAFVAVCFYGIRAAAVIGLAAVSAMLTDFVCLFLRGRPYRLVDLSNLGNAVVLALLFPATVPYSVVILSTVFAVAVGTHVFGYRKDLLFPPAAVGYLFALICWKDEILQFPDVGTRLELFPGEVALQPSFSSLFNEKGSIRFLHTDLLEVMIGAVPGAMGTGCILLLLLGIVILTVRGQLNIWAVLASVAFMIFPILSGSADYGIWSVNMILFSILFFLADPAVMPCRSFAAYPAAFVTALLSGYLIAVYQIEYAPLIAVILTCPVWRWIASLKFKHAADAPEDAAQTEAAQEEVTANGI